MPTIISHAAVPLAVGLGLGPKRVPRALLIAGIAASMLPDADVILFRFGVSADSIWSHRGFSHSLGFAVLLGIAAALLLRRVAAPTAAFLFVAASAASHGLLDMLTNGGHGVALLWPLTVERFHFDWRPIQVSPLAASRFVTKAGAVAKTEAIWIWGPATLVALSLRGLAGRKGAKP